MTTPHKITIKYFLTDPDSAELSGLVPLFHRWIREQTLDGVLIDVADYRHVPDGPGLLLIGHEGDLSLDLADGRPGLRYSRKRGWPSAEPVDRLTTAWEQAWAGARRLEQESPLALDHDGVEIAFVDRLQVANSAEAFTDLHDAILAAAAAVHPDRPAAAARVANDPRRPLTVRVTLGGRP